MLNINTMKSKHLTAIIISATLTAISFSGCLYPSQKESVKRSGLYFDTYISVEIYDSDNTCYLDDVFKMCDHYEHIFSPSVQGSDIYNINNSEGNEVLVDPETIHLLNDSIKYCQKSDGVFDITVYPVSKLWNFSDNASHTIPDQNEISKALTHVNYNLLNIDTENNTVYLDDSLSAIDPGSIAKGYIADRINEYLKSCNVNSAIINMGGDISVIGSKDDGIPFTIGITDPNNKNNVIMGLEITDKAVATSGIYERCFTENNILYHHILDTKTGYPCDTDINSVTIITDSAEKADALCTLCILMGSDPALKYIESCEKDTEVIIIKRDGTILKSEQADKFIKH